MHLYGIQALSAASGPGSLNDCPAGMLTLNAPLFALVQKKLWLIMSVFFISSVSPTRATVTRGMNVQHAGP